MNLITTNQYETMTSKELYDIVCLARVEHGESQPRMNDFHARIADELEGDHYESFVVQNMNKTETKLFRLTIDQCTLVGMRESKAVRRSVLAKLKKMEVNQVPKPMTTLEMIAGMATSMVEVERNQAEQAKALQNLSAEVEEIRESTTIWDQRPSNAEGITALRNRINSIYGIPKWAIDEALRSAYGPRPAGSVRNTHESANGSTYVVYWISDVTRMFDRIAKEAERVTATLVEHPVVSKRFKLL